MVAASLCLWSVFSVGEEDLGNLFVRFWTCRRSIILRQREHSLSTSIAWYRIQASPLLTITRYNCRRMLSAYSQVCFAVVLAVFCHAQALAPSHHNNKLANHGFGNKTRCTCNCTITEDRRPRVVILYCLLFSCVTFHRVSFLLCFHLL